MSWEYPIETDGLLHLGRRSDATPTRRRAPTAADIVVVPRMRAVYSVLMTQVHDDLVVSRPLSNGPVSYTLGSRLGAMLSEIEQLYGPRDSSWTILGYEFFDAVPHIWFPGNCGHVLIRLGTSALEYPVRAYYQLAHECVHLLDPSTQANVLEEGLAAKYAIGYARKIDPLYQSDDPKYDAAERLASRLLQLAPDAVRNLRSRHVKLWAVGANDLKKECHALLDADAVELAKPFSSWTPVPV